MKESKKLFQKYPLQAKKKHSFEKFCMVAKLILAKRHLTNTGVEEIRDLVRDSLDAGNPHVQWGAE